MGTAEWTEIWWWWLFAVLCTFGALEGYSIFAAGNQRWTLSDTIRRWSVKERWLAPLVIGFTVALMYHFFGQLNQVPG